MNLPPNHPEYEPDDLLDDIEAVTDAIKVARESYTRCERLALSGDQQGAEDARDRAQKAMDEIRAILTPFDQPQAAPSREQIAELECEANTLRGQLAEAQAAIRMALDLLTEYRLIYGSTNRDDDVVSALRDAVREAQS